MCLQTWFPKGWAELSLPPHPWFPPPKADGDVGLDFRALLIPCAALLRPPDGRGVWLDAVWRFLEDASGRALGKDAECEARAQASETRNPSVRRFALVLYGSGVSGTDPRLRLRHKTYFGALTGGSREGGVDSGPHASSGLGDLGTKRALLEGRVSVPSGGRSRYLPTRRPVTRAEWQENFRFSRAALISPQPPLGGFISPLGLLHPEPLTGTPLSALAAQAAVRMASCRAFPAGIPRRLPEGVPGAHPGPARDPAALAAGPAGWTARS